MDAIGRPVGVFVAASAVRELHHVAAGHIHDENVEVARFISASPRKRNVLSVGAPRGVDRIPFPSAQAGNVGSFYIFAVFRRALKQTQYRYRFWGWLWLPLPARGSE